MVALKTAVVNAGRVNRLNDKRTAVRILEMLRKRMAGVANRINPTVTSIRRLSSKFRAPASQVVFCVYQQYLIKDRVRELCFKAFLNNNWFGLVLFIGVMLDYQYS